MALKLTDVKPGDILRWRDRWYVLITQDYNGGLTRMKYVWISGNASPRFYEKEGFRDGNEDIFSMETMLQDANFLTHIDVGTLISELKKLEPEVTNDGT